MLCAILCTFRPGAFAHAKSKREQHYAFLNQHFPEIVEGGPLLGPDGIPTAMLLIVDKPDLDAATTFIQQEPYTASGFFESVAVRQWSHVIPEPTPGYVKSEWEKEKAINTTS